MKSLQKSLVAETWVVNASPVIALARVGQVELLARLPGQALIPQAVAEELSVAPEDDPARIALESGIFKAVKAPAIPETILAWDLGKGESAVLSYVLAHPKSVAILDDGAARRCARSFSLALTGTLSVVILAKQHGLIDSAAQVLQPCAVLIFGSRMRLFAMLWRAHWGKSGRQGSNISPGGRGSCCRRWMNCRSLGMNRRRCYYVNSQGCHKRQQLNLLGRH